jgi:hypothetical protein
MVKYSSWRKHSQWDIPVVSSDDLQKCIEKTADYLSPFVEFVVKDSSGKIIHEQCIGGGW